MFIQIFLFVEWKRKTWISHDMRTNLSKFWSGNKNWKKKNFFWRIVALKQKSGLKILKSIFFVPVIVSFGVKHCKIIFCSCFCFCSKIWRMNLHSSLEIRVFRSKEKMVSLKIFISLINSALRNGIAIYLVKCIDLFLGLFQSRSSSNRYLIVLKWQTIWVSFLIRLWDKIKNLPAN